MKHTQSFPCTLQDWISYMLPGTSVEQQLFESDRDTKSRSEIWVAESVLT